MASLHPWHLGPSWVAMGIGLLSVPCVAVARTLFQATGRSMLHHSLECFVLRQERSFSPIAYPNPYGVRGRWDKQCAQKCAYGDAIGVPAHAFGVLRFPFCVFRCITE